MTIFSLVAAAENGDDLGLCVELNFITSRETLVLQYLPSKCLANLFIQLLNPCIRPSKS